MQAGERILTLGFRWVPRLRLLVGKRTVAPGRVWSLSCHGKYPSQRPDLYFGHENECQSNVIEYCRIDARRTKYNNRGGFVGSSYFHG